MSNSPRGRPRIAIVWRGRPDAEPVVGERLAPMAAALSEAGVEPVGVVWSEAAAATARARLLACDGALVWVDPLTLGQDRAALDALLSEASRRGLWVSARPEVILKMGVKQVLTRTRDLGWGSDVHAYDDETAFRRAFPARLAADGVRVLKQNRGNGSQGVWKVALQDAAAAVGPDSLVDLVEARGDETERGVSLAAFMDRCVAYLTGDGVIVDQAFQPRVGEGMIRCYMSGGQVIGFSEQFPRSRTLADPHAPTFGMAREKTMHAAAAAPFQRLRRLMEDEWTPGLRQRLAIGDEDLPALWDADFLRGPPDADGGDRYVLCEINVSCVIPFPEAAPAAVAAAALAGVGAGRG